MQINAFRIEKTLREAKAKKRDIKLADGHGLYLLVRTNGTAVWRHKYYHGTKICDGPKNKGKTVPREWLATLGKWDEVSIADARELHMANRVKLGKGINPMEEKREAKNVKEVAGTDAKNTFAALAARYIAHREHELAPATISKHKWHLKLVDKTIGDKPVKTLVPTDIIAALEALEESSERGKPMIETGHKTLDFIVAVLDFAIAKGIIEVNVALGRRKAIKKRDDKHYAAITKEADIAKLLRDIDGYTGKSATRNALRLAPHVFLRPGELRGGKWSEIDFKAATWTIPKERMKGKLGKQREHLVPLSKQAIAILKEQKETTDSEFIFPAIGAKPRPISENTLNQALLRLKYEPTKMVPHGFRSMASTRLNEMGYSASDIELQLAHADKNSIRAIYNRSERIQARAKMMAEWSDYLEMLRIGGSKVVSIKKRAS